MTFMDGSWYDGDWKEGLRHGTGEFHQKYNDKVTIYKGQWYNDLKHGIGEEEYPDKLFEKYYNVQGIWYHNTLNGVAKLGRKEGCCGGNQKMLVFKDGMSIDLSTGEMSCGFYIYVFFSIVFLGAIIAGGAIQ